jgi:hypothetical protein
VLGFFFFRKASERTRTAMFVLLIIGVASFGYATFSNSHQSSPLTSPVLGQHSELGATGGVPRPNGQSQALAPRMQGPLSTDRDRPTPLVSDTLRGSGMDRERVHYFCSFSGGPGEVKVTFDFTARAMTEMVLVNFYDEDFRKVGDTIITGGNTGDSVREVRRMQLSSRQKVIVEIDLDCKGGTAGTFLLRVEGAAQF